MMTNIVVDKSTDNAEPLSICLSNTARFNSIVFFVYYFFRVLFGQRFYEASKALFKEL